jgi:hypothetical protein
MGQVGNFLNFNSLLSFIEMDENKKKRLEQVLTVMNKIRNDLKLPMDSTPVKELQSRLSDWVATGIPWSGTINFAEFGRMAEVKCPRVSTQLLEVLLRVVRAGK